MTDALDACRAKKKELDAVRPIAPEQERRILQKLRLEWDFHSNHLEGNSLSYGETQALILHGLTAQGKPLKDHFEITGHHEAVLWVEDLVKQRQPLTEAVIRQLHQLILKEDHYLDALTEDGKPTRILVEAGRYKTSPNHVRTITGELLLFSSPVETPIHMRELLDWYATNQETDPIELASIFHHRFTRIHPFADGNGRVARLVSNFILMMNGYPPVIIKTQEKDKYFTALRLADASNPRAFVEYIATSLTNSLDLMLRGARGESIEELDDVRKEVALLRQQFDATQRVNALKTPALAQEAWRAWMRPLLEQFEESSRQFDSFYLQKHMQVVVGSTARTGTLSDQFEVVLGKIGSARDIALNIQYSQIRTRAHVSKTFSTSIYLTLLDTHVEVLDTARQKIGEVDWDKCPSAEDMRRWVHAEELRHLTFLRPLVAQPAG